MKNQLLILTLLGCALFLTTCKREDGSGTKTQPDAISTDGLSEEELKALMEEENRLSGLSHGASSTTIDVITDAAELANVRKQYPHTFSASLQSGLQKGDPKALAELKSRLRSSDPDVQISGLYELNPFWDMAPMKVDAEVRQLVHALVDKPKTRYTAIEALPATDPENAAPKLEQLLKGSSLDATELRPAILAIGKTKARPSTVQLLINMLKGSREKDLDRQKNNLIHALLDQYETGDLGMRKTIEKQLIPYTDDPEIDDHVQHRIVETFAANPIPSMLPFFQANLDDPKAKAACLQGIAGIQGKGSQALVRKSLASPSEAMMAVKVIPLAWKGDSKGAIQALLTAYDNIEGEYDQHKLINLAWQAGGAAGAKEFASSLPDAKSQKAYLEAYHLLYDPIGEDHPLQIKAKKLAASGLLTRPITLQDMEAIRESNREYDAWSWDETFMDHVGTVVWFDAETGQFPNPYDELILNTFVPGTQGKLDGLECYMRWSDADEDNPDEEVWIIFKGKGYHFVPEYYGDWYDLGAVESVLEKILEDNGIAERFVSWDTGDQTAGYVFATPAKAKEVIKTLELDRIAQ